MQECDYVPDKCCRRFPLAMNSYTNALFLESSQYPIREIKFSCWTVVKSCASARNCFLPCLDDSESTFTATSVSSFSLPRYTFPNAPSPISIPNFLVIFKISPYLKIVNLLICPLDSHWWNQSDISRITADDG